MSDAEAFPNIYSYFDDGVERYQSPTYMDKDDTYMGFHDDDENDICWDDEEKD